MIPGKQYSFDTLLQIARRRKWLIVLPALLIAAVGAAVDHDAAEPVSLRDADPGGAAARAGELRRARR